jgi:hypothetical protein
MIDPRYISTFKVSRDYAKWIESQQKKNWYKILQPNHPRYKEFYGAQEARNKAIKEKQEAKAKAEWQEAKERRTYSKRRTIIV